ncbi:Stk1 family PASTA domain-containing Ser/Thr kinase [Bifidobacterium sp. ESL0745]|uniref:Stk1 family PASTA domain-containing Ser/Thr kinase n=1 Tax=Bifidobacterium sp. ESL0745 TaxID=2983226 RepID=UPI0023F7A899|nr:Stk1 family PASTA domain-containing Ser/Thr kinase [Bifidobacterium sp. ESL0745]MDF7665940.1 Stk1 family PASTA domain-containing Ser/Thr kinase [Bifidobacterium sp. ESL0745]
MSTNMPTSLANGRYQLGQLIGRGGMAEVHIAQDTRLGRVVAIKIMRSDLANDDIFLKRFAREAHSVAQMNNVNIVNIYDSGEEAITTEDGNTERVPYIVMEYVKGQTLRDIIKANGPLSQRDTEQVMLGVLNALDYSHRMGIIHRDIKPGNIMISEQGMVKVMDFGIARALDDSVATMTQSQGVVGTAQYLSPEQARGETVDMRSDLYSAGCVLYEMLTGRAPFTGDSAVAIAYQHVSEVATPPSAIVPGLPKMWDQICAKAMAKDRQNRYTTAAEFRNDILTYMNGGVPVAAAFNPLTDLANMKERKQAEQTAATEAMNPIETTATQAFNPLTGTYGNTAATQLAPGGNTALKSRAEKASEDKTHKKKVIIGSIIGAIVAILAIAGIAYGVTHMKKAETVTVPTFNSTTTQARAEEQLQEVGLKMQVEQDTDSTEPKGTFTKQNPSGGAKAAKGSTVKVWFSTGPQSGQIPNVKGKSVDEAKAVLKKAGFKVAPTTQTEDSPDVAQGMVTRTDPAAGQPADKGTSLMLYVSSGMAKVPDVTGQQQDQALNQLKAFTVVVQQESSDSVAQGLVTRTDPGSGASIAQKSNVTVYVSTGKEKVSVPNGISFGTTTLSQAQSILQGFSIQVTPGNPQDGTAIVTGMSPSPGQQIEKGGTITLSTKAPAQQPTTNNGSTGTGGSTSTNGTGTGNGSTDTNGTNTGNAGNSGNTANHTNGTGGTGN